MFGAQLFAEENPPDFRVTIIAVTQFEDPELQDKDLNDANSEAANGLKRYFEGRGVSVDLYTTPEETSQEFLRHWLFIDLPHDSRRGLHLIFVLTHGLPAADRLYASANKGQLYIATSDTYKDHIPGKAIRGGDFIDAFQDMPPSATVFLFLDTCRSGAIDSANLRTLLLHEPEFASRVMIFAAARSDEDAYRARFTNALLNIWQSKTPTPHCGENSIEQFLTASLRNVPGVSPDVKQTVRVVAPLGPGFCIEDFNSTQRFLMLFNRARGEVSVRLQAGDQPDQEIGLKQFGWAPVTVRPTTYTMIAKLISGDEADESTSDVKTIDLTSTPAKVEVLFSSDPLDVAEASQRTAQYLDSRGILPSVSADLKQSSIEAVARLSGQLTAQLQLSNMQELDTQNKIEAATSDLKSKETILAELNQHYSVGGGKAPDVSLHESSVQAKAAQPDGDVHATSVQPMTAQADGDVHATSVQPTTAQADGGFHESSVQTKTAQSDYDDAKHRVDELESMVQQIKLVKLRDQAGLNRVEGLKKSASDFAAKRTESIELEASARTKLKPLFRDVQLNDRGVQVTLVGASAEAVTKPDLLRKFVDVSNQYPSLDVEIELLHNGENSIENQLSVRARAGLLMKELRELGLRSENAVARGLMARRKNEFTINLILSQL
jgi:hypothetical protein